MRRLFIHAALPLFAGLGFFVGLSTAEPHAMGAYQTAALRIDPFLGSEPTDLAAAEGAESSEALAPSSLADLAPAAPALHVTVGDVRRGSTLSHAMTSRGIPPDVVDVIADEMKPHFDFRLARAGHSFQLAQDSIGRVVDFRYRVSNTSSYHMRRVGDGTFEIAREEAMLVPRSARIAGAVSGSLYDSITALGEKGELARGFADVFAWDIDFQRSVQPGDTFEILYERLYRTEQDGSEHYMHPGRILAARYEGTAGLHTAVFFEHESGAGGYYRPDGTSVQGEFLMAPLRHGRITSHYSAARRHPVLKVVRPHHGIDYAAPHGTPVWAVASGEVIYRARAGGFGNLVKVRHSNGYVSYYAHLSRFPNDLEVGQWVGQKEVIGYVGSTGLSTGPHVCFRVAKNGRYVNPSRLRTPAGSPVSDELMGTFRAATGLLLDELRGGTRVVATES